VTQLTELHDIAVSGMGMVSSLGHDAATSCAAARAGLTRIAEHDAFRVYDPTSEATLGVPVHQVFATVHGFSGLGRLVRLAAQAMEDPKLNLNDGDLSKTALILNVSSQEHRKLVAEDLAGQDGVSESGDSTTADEIARELNDWKARLIPTLLKVMGVSSTPMHSQVFVGDETGFLESMVRVLPALESGQVDRILIGGIDSLVEVAALNALQQLNILATPENPIGVIPGEMAAFLLITGNSSNNDVTRYCTINSIAITEWTESAPPGKELAECILSTGSSIGDDSFVVVTDLNGESRRANEWGAALVHLNARDLRSVDSQIHPATSFGYVGAASVPASVCMISSRFEREPEPEQHAIVWTSGSNQKRASLGLQRV